ncbi:MAG: heparan-alpha-glucosaminide N-acetyltransferase domain-containing protein [Saprospiraceae bacterium]|nr:heparan-alpha-glucosaminide N-acetyltransferase domain-containing protein [Saprospiraceae bacterium]
MQQRLLSIDIFRGMTIAFMIIVNSPGSWEYVYAPLRHASWHGCTPTDLVFPFFIFAVGLSMAFSMRNLQKKTTSQWTTKILKRTLLIFLVGFLLNWFPFFHKNLLDVRVFGVLQRIGLSYGLAALLILFVQKQKYLLSTIVLGLLGYTIIMKMGGDFTLENNFGKKLDSMLLPDQNIYGGFGTPFDPEGLLGSIPSAMHVIIGFLVGKYLIDNKANPSIFLKYIFPFGIVLAGVAYFGLDPFIPINKPLWTPSYVLFTSGLSCILLGLLVYILDVKKIQKWSLPFNVFGRNALFSYVLSIVLVKVLIYLFKFEDGNGYSKLYTSLYQPLLGNYLGSFSFALSIVFVVFIGAYILFKKNILIKL